MLLLSVGRTCALVQRKPAPPGAGESTARRNEENIRHSGLDPESSSFVIILRRFAPGRTILDSGSSPE
jgi:hypothetical protein